ncbi:hypothetical protein l11_08300 [Neisseria weaveri LMG 5135]|nr:hypothetical protein l13_07550 [Neisseria weaveri ATCC 51223]EGV37880.1 hypothetical protein l11_08300 [Neisseria weaveri LMG 5135]
MPLSFTIPVVIQYHLRWFIFRRPHGCAPYFMNTILLTGLIQRLLIALLALAFLWSVYFWAVGA